jgi:putative nucleotidyltransferase with HDIG domain
VTEPHQPPRQEPARAPAPLAALADIAPQGWLVGGALRDRLLGRFTSDYDVVVGGQEVEVVARALARATAGFAFTLSEAFGAWRVVARDRGWQVDLMPLVGERIDDDLARRDLTVNAIAQRLGTQDLVDPYGGIADLRARRLRTVCSHAFADDPLRTLRLVRLACELDFTVERETMRIARAQAPQLATVAPERIFAELARLVRADRALDGLETMHEAGVAAAVLPELEALRGVEQSRFHHLDVFEHTRAVLAEAMSLQADPARLFGEHGPALKALLSQPLANELSRADGLRFGALVHDIAKPRTRAVTDAGRITFMGHDQVGAAMAGGIMRRLRASDRLAEHVAALTRHHLRLGFLVHEMPLGRRAVYGYLTACAPVQVDVTLLSVADRLATRGDNAELAIARHLELARQLIGEALSWAADPPRSPVRGDELARALGLAPGPVIGELLDQLEEASFAGEVSSREEAIERARELIGGR